MDSMTEKAETRIILLSDTHIYKPQQAIPRRILRYIRKVKPDHILHCGDICRMDALDALNAIAPVSAVRGNRDFRNFRSLPRTYDETFQGYRLHMEHGEGNIFSYLRIKMYCTWHDITRKNCDVRKLNFIRPDVNDFDIYCVGHSHYKRLEMVGHTLLINPGHINVSKPFEHRLPPSFCDLRLRTSEIEVTFITLDGKRLIREHHLIEK